MPMTIVVTRAVPDRFRGFLASAMLEIAPGVYTGPRMSAGVRERIWVVLSKWHEAFGHEEAGAILMTWPDKTASGGQAIRMLGLPAKEIVDADGVLVVKTV